MKMTITYTPVWAGTISYPGTAFCVHGWKDGAHCPHCAEQATAVPGPVPFVLAMPTAKDLLKCARDHEDFAKTPVAIRRLIEKALVELKDGAP